MPRSLPTFNKMFTFDYTFCFLKKSSSTKQQFQKHKKLVAVYYCLICDVISQTFTSSLISHKEELLRNRVSEGMKEAETAVAAILHYTLQLMFRRRTFELELFRYYCKNVHQKQVGIVCVEQHPNLLETAAAIVKPFHLQIVYAA